MNEFKPTFDSFQEWYKDNPELVENLQTWLFYSYAVAEGNVGVNVESQIEVADLTVYLLLFYLSSLNNNSYTIETTLDELAQILETQNEVVLTALESLEAHHVIHYHDHDLKLGIHIEPIQANIGHSHN